MPAPTRPGGTYWAGEPELPAVRRRGAAAGSHAVRLAVRHCAAGAAAALSGRTSRPRSWSRCVTGYGWRTATAGAGVVPVAAAAGMDGHRGRLGRRRADRAAGHRGRPVRAGAARPTARPTWSSWPRNPASASAPALAGAAGPDPGPAFTSRGATVPGRGQGPGRPAIRLHCGRSSRRPTAARTRGRRAGCGSTPSPGRRRPATCWPNRSRCTTWPQSRTVGAGLRRAVGKASPRVCRRR